MIHATDARSRSEQICVIIAICAGASFASDLAPTQMWTT